MSTALADWSYVLIFTAGVIYVMAFVAFALDLASRASDTVSERRRALNIGFALTILGFVVELGGVVLRGIAAHRVPWANMYEFAITGTTIIVGVFLIVSFVANVKYLGTFVLGLVVLVLVLATMLWYVDVSPLMPALQSYWIVIHVLVAILGTGFFTVGAAGAIVQLMQSRREKLPDDQRPKRFKFLRSFPSATSLEATSYRVNIVGFVFWTFTLIFGAIWAEKAWGRYWGWDTKEVWTFIIWVIYAGYIHARSTQGWRGDRAAWLSLVGFAAVLFNFGIVNVFFKGLHVYSGL